MRDAVATVHMKCQTCGNENADNAQFCTSCGVSLGSATASGCRRAIKVWLVGGLVGLGTSMSFIMTHDALTTDLMFDLWEFGITLITPALIAVVVALVTKSRLVIVLAVAYLTLLIPVLGPAFGGTGSEPIWAFAVLGLVGGLVWSTPFALSALLRRRQ